MANELDALKTVDYAGVRELARAAKHFLQNSGTNQTKNTVTDYPNERTIRYYIAEGLLDQAIEKRGVMSIFRYEHLLTLLVIKKLQSNGLPINVIKSVLESRSVDELENLLGEEIHVFRSEKELQDFRRSVGHTDEGEVKRIEVPFAAPTPPPPNEAHQPARSKRSSAKEYLESILLGKDHRSKRGATPPSPGTSLKSVDTSLQRGTSDWRRYEIVSGVELHIARSYRPTIDATFRQRLLVLIDGILHSRER
jgi:DNA-binding transcriptional MerR regulator